uniref:Uncharacterized protein n=1 Tax=Picea sitchensis TaxID=3332 RepID=A0A6B9XU16_PICSI|nr:hypothetical protein Q903MT_gene3883 [Picea sitchensis]
MLYVLNRVYCLRINPGPWLDRIDFSIARALGRGIAQGSVGRPSYPFTGR